MITSCSNQYNNDEKGAPWEWSTVTLNVEEYFDGNFFFNFEEIISPDPHALTNCGKASLHARAAFLDELIRVKYVRSAKQRQ